MQELTDRLRKTFAMQSWTLRETAREINDVSDIVDERMRFVAVDGETVRGVVLRPRNVDRPGPAILYIHAHGNRHAIGASELTAGRPALQGALGPVLARAGFVTLCIDLPCFGERSHRSESAVAKAMLWRGQNLAGRMLGELASAMDWLAARPDVDSGRIGAFGISMGATLGYWLAAVDARIAAIAHLCCYADFEALIEAEAHDLHGIYLTVPGLLPVAGNGEIAGLIAPRRQLICIGDLDPLTPPGAVDTAWGQTLEAYRRAGAADRLTLHREAQTGHQESPAMRSAVLDFFDRL